MHNFLQDLNAQQLEAVKYCDGAQLVIAGAGSGKTRVLTYKIAYLLSTGMKPWNILALTFTNKAANEMKQRIDQLVGEGMARRLYMGTFHSIFCCILRAEATLLGFKSNFTIYDESDSRSLINTIIKELALDDTVYKAAAVQGIIGMAKNNLVTAEQYIASREYYERDKQCRRPATGKIFMEYVSRCRKANAMDFDDLLLLTFMLFKEHPDTLQKYSGIFHYVLVDEYQDTNYAQQRIISLLTEKHKHVCMVGDDAQSIYAFRGANIDYMLRFQKDKDLRIFKLEQNYRSTQSIVQAANSLIIHNKNQIKKDVFSKNDRGERIVFKPTFSDREEASVVCKEIKRLHNKELSRFDEFCVLYRTNAQSRTFEEEMRKQGIPYRIYGGLSFYQRKEIKDIIAYLRMATNADDEEAIRRIINYPTRGIGASTVQKLAVAARKHKVSIWQIVSSPMHYGVEINRGMATKIASFRNMIATFAHAAKSSDAFTLGKDIIEKSGIMADISSDTSPEGVSRKDNMEEFMSALRDFVDDKREQGDERVNISDFLQEVSLMSDIDRDDGENERVSLMTVHAAKGLEFTTVFVVGLEENIFPSPRSLDSVCDLEEERRLLYVAITRAKRHCYLTCARSRYRYGKMEFGTPSRFIKDIAPELLNTDAALPFWPSEDGLSQRNTESRVLAPKPYSQQRQSLWAQKEAFKPIPKSNPASATSSSCNLREGNVIEHQRFGVGTVIKVEGGGENTKATVQFQNVGTKQLLLKFARYKVLK